MSDYEDNDLPFEPGLSGKKENPPKEDDFIKTIESLLDDDTDADLDHIEISAEESNLIEISEKEDSDAEEELSEEDLEEYDSAIAASISEVFGEVEKEAEKARKAAEEAALSANQSDTEGAQGEQPDSDRIPEGATAYVGTDLDERNEEIPDEEEIMEDINAALALQVNYEMQQKQVETKEKKPKLWLLALIPILGIAVLFTKWKEGMPKWFMAARITVFSLFACFLIGTVATGGKLIYNIAGWYVSMRMQSPDEHGDSKDLTAAAQLSPSPFNNPTQPVDPDNPDAADPTEPSATPTPTNIPREEENIVNILLLGEEAIDMHGYRGNTDLIMIATLDTKDKTVKLTSLMRDMLVAVPGHTDTRINSVYQIGGIELLYETISLNFEIILDGYMMVGFDSFEEIINNLDGVMIELSEEEANYLNTTNYISKEEYRTVIPGMNKMNGNQALGYCRIRKVPTLSNIHSDFGRTSRQRIVLNAIFEKVKSDNLVELAFLADECLPLVRTDLTAEQLSDYMQKVVENRITNFVQLRIPIDGSYGDTTFNGQTDLIKVNFPENIRALHEFIFGDYQE